MSGKTFNTRLVSKHDVEVNWLKAVNFIPMQGEIVIYDIDENYTYERFKIGDGKTIVGDLPFATENIEGKYLPEGTPWIGIEQCELLPTRTLTVDENVGGAIITSRIGFNTGSIYTVSYNGQQYECVAQDLDGGVAIGDIGLMAGGTSTGEPFIIAEMPAPQDIGDGTLAYGLVIPIDGSTEITVSIYGPKITYHTLPEELMPYDARTHFVKGSSEGSVRHVNSVEENADYRIGEYAFAEGSGTTAYGDYAHAEGEGTAASGSYSHAEGLDTIAYGSGSHAEGSGRMGDWSVSLTGEANTTSYTITGNAYGIGVGRVLKYGEKCEIITEYNSSTKTVTTESTLSDTALSNATVAVYCGPTASGTGSHAEGNGTTAYGMYSHAEGNGTTASGANSHAEGNVTTASGDNSHAEGYYTTASGTYQHVQGRYNIVDDSNTYAHIVGDGTKSKPSNAHTLDWNGNAWFAGDVYVGSTSGTNKDNGSVKLVTEADAFNIVDGGSTWTMSTLPNYANWHSVTYGDGKFVAVSGNDGVYDSNAAAYSTDGITWTMSTLPSSADWHYVTYGDGKFVAVAYSTDTMAYSTDGITWTASTMPRAAHWESVAYGDGKFVAITGSSKTAYSTDGINWIESTLPGAAAWSSIAYGDGKFLVVPSSSSNIAVYSTDGITWTESTLPRNASWQSITYGDGKFVVVPSSHGSSAVYSTDGVTWAYSNLPKNATWYSITYGANKFVAVARDNGIAAYSTNGVTWIESTLPSSALWYSVAYGDGKFVAVAYDSDAAAYSIAYPRLFKSGEDVTSDVSDALGIDAIKAQPDWNQADETASDYIKNKPTADDALDLVAEMALVDPIAADDGSIYTDENGVLFTL